jgi:DNA repair exonuclease SbcCD nuclease subunit
MERQPIAIVITDTHLAENTIDVNHSVYDQVLDFCEGLEIKIVIHGGDIFESRKGQPEVVLNAFSDILDKFEARGIRMVGIAGNHDKTDYTSERSFLRPYDRHPSFDLINPYGMIRLGNVNIILLPFYDEKLKYPEMLEASCKFIEEGGINILVTHVGIDKARTNGGRELESNIKPDMFDQFSTVLVGHYHDRHMVGDKICYIGSAYQANFGEDDQKGCALIYDDGSIDLLNLDFPTYKNVVVTAEEITPELIQEISQNGGNHKLKISGKITKELEPMINVLNSMGVKLETVSETFDPVQPQVQANLQLTHNDILESFDQWADSKKVEDVSYGRELLVKKLT